MDAATHLRALTRSQGTLIRRLLREKNVRSQEGAFVVEGTKSCLDLIDRHAGSIRSLVLCPRYLRTETDAERQVRSQLLASQFVCPDSAFEKLTDVERPQGMLAVVRQPRWDEAQVFNQTKVLGIYADRLQDPANVGAIIRTAAALGLSGVWLSAECADPFGPKVVRAAAGSIVNIPIFWGWEIRTFSSYRCEIYSAVLPSADIVSIRDIHKIPSRLVIAVGNEGTGLAPDVVAASPVKFSIPLANGIESLNVAATAAISAFYFRGLRCHSTGEHGGEASPEGMEI
ncbi:MAG: RNA methyltransferase [Nitrospira sp.]|nr:RNA methyltransferase [Nitrospira sp.]MDH4245495.1 RNA methyltransferase [Nitrospira sp.]MDH4357565.1 RNA methyltransferase [Nitrospira sp.]MDH5319802.1 RNA methyltransferase [Nitrospira sp.]